MGRGNHPEDTSHIQAEPIEDKGVEIYSKRGKDAPITKGVEIVGGRVAKGVVRIFNRMKGESGVET